MLKYEQQIICLQKIEFYTVRKKTVPYREIHIIATFLHRILPNLTFGKISRSAKRFFKKISLFTDRNFFIS